MSLVDNTMPSPIAISTREDMKSKEPKECSICIEKYTKTKRKEIVCSSCQHGSCMECVKTYLLNSTDEPHCMNCRKGWGRETQYNLLGPGFINGAYRNHRKQQLFERQKALLPATQSNVDRILRKRSLEDKRYELRNKINRLQYELKDLDRELYNLSRDGGVAPSCNPHDIQQLLKCPKDECRGYIDKKECRLCKSFICRDCMVLVSTQEELDEHMCDKDTKETAQLILKSSKPCPACGTRISKVSGCDQMWCIQPDCGTAFSWRTGQKVNGVVHNPHYYEYMRKRGSERLRNIGDVACGGILGFDAFLGIITNYIEAEHKTTYEYKAAFNIHRSIGHIQNTLINPLRLELNQRDPNLEKRSLYMMNELDEGKFKTHLVKQDNHREKAQSILNIYETYVTLATERVNEFTQVPDIESLKKMVEEVSYIRDYIQNQLSNVSRNFKSGVAMFKDNFKVDENGNGKDKFTMNVNLSYS